MKEFIFRGTDDGEILNDEPVCEIVRCKDCKHFVGYGWCILTRERHKESWFCPYGERRTD